MKRRTIPHKMKEVNKIKTFVGLGNFDFKYNDTKHNAGYWVVDELSKRLSEKFQTSKQSYVYAINKKYNIVLIKPTTGMNLSGIAVKQVCNKWQIPPSNVYVILDDIDLPLGSIRIKPKGGDGCHKGLESVLNHMGTKKIPRIRFGIAACDKIRPSEQYVLKPFRKKDQTLVNKMIFQTADAIQYLIDNDIQKTMNRFNQ